MAFPLLPALGLVVPTIVGAIKDRVAPTPAPAQTLGKDDFLKLLVEQIRHQDPLSPMDNDKFIAQTAQFSSLEELQNINKSIERLAAGSASPVAGATAFLGKPVTATSAAFTYAASTVSLPFSLAAPAQNAAIEITDASGSAVVARLPLGPLPGGPHSLDLTPGAAGRSLPAGQYRYRVVDQGSAAARGPLNAITGTVTGISLENGTPVLLLGSRRINLADVTAVSLATN